MTETAASRVLRSGPIRSALTMLAAVAAVVILIPSAQLESRQSGAWHQDWNVRCSWLDRLTIEALSEVFAEFLQQVAPDSVGELAQEYALRHCDDTQDGLAGWSRIEFRAASRWLEGLEFDDPIIQTAPTIDTTASGVVVASAPKYLAWLDQFLFLRRDDNVRQRPLVRDPGGDVMIDDNGFYYDVGEIFISPGMVDYRPMPVEAHEQFHGVQHRYAPTVYPGDKVPKKWVWEGTARVEDYVWSRKTGRPTFTDSRPFHVPLWDLNWNPYGNYRFWREVGRQLRSPEYIDYFKDIYAGVESGPAFPLAVDRVLQRLFRDRGEPNGGFYRAYPEFVRFELRDPRRTDLIWPMQPVVLSLPGRAGDALDGERLTQNLPVVSTHAYPVYVYVPAGRMGALRIELPQDEPNLHLIVDDRRYNRVIDQPTDPNGKRNRFAIPISGSDEWQFFYVRLANAPPLLVDEDQVDPYEIQFTLTSNHAQLAAAGGESMQLEAGVLFSYVNINRDPTDMAQAMQPGMIDRYADHAGITMRTPAGPVARETIAAASASALGAPPPPRRPGEGRSSNTAGAECLATITLFDDASRTVAKILWRGATPLLGGTHDIQGSFATGVHDAVYTTLKGIGQGLTMVEDPEALAQQMEQMRDLAVPGLADAARMAGEGAAAGAIESVLGGLFGGVGFPSREGQSPSPNSGQADFGRSYDQGGQGVMTVEPGPGDQIVATYQFSASGSETGGTVNVSGRFVAVPGPLSTENLWNGCETLHLPAEDNESMPIQPADYPPGFDDEPFPWPPVVFWPCIPDWDNPTITEVVSWHPVRVEADGTEVWQRTVKKTPDVLLRAFPPGVDALEAPCNPRTEPEERRLPPPGPDPSPCISGPMADWQLEVIQDWHEATTDDGRQVWRRRVKWHPTIEVPARNGGDESDCQPYEDYRDIDIPPDPDEDSDCVPGPRSEWQVSVWLDWYEEESAGETVVVRVLEIVPTVLRPPRGNGSWLPCRTRYVTEERAVGEEGTSISVPGDDVPGGGTVSRPPGTPEPGGGETLEIRGPMVLDFLEEGQADLQSPPQPVAGSASLTEIAVTGGSFALDLNQSSADVNACSSNMGIRMAVQMIAGQGAFAGDIVLSASAGQLILNLTFSEGTIAVQAPVTLTPLPTGVRGNVSDGRLELRPNGQGNYSCSANTMDFAFTLTQAP